MQYEYILILSCVTHMHIWLYTYHMYVRFMTHMHRYTYHLYVCMYDK